MSNIFKLCPTHFSRGGEKILGGLRPPAPSLVTGMCQTQHRFVTIVRTLPESL